MKKYLFLFVIIGLTGCTKENYMQVSIRECFEKGGKITYSAWSIHEKRPVASGSKRYMDKVMCETHYGAQPAHIPNIIVERPSPDTIIFRDMNGRPLIDR